MVNIPVVQIDGLCIFYIKATDRGKLLCLGPQVVALIIFYLGILF